MKNEKGGNRPVVPKSKTASVSEKAAPVSGRVRLLEAALRQLRTSNLSAVTARTICQEAKITAPTLYHYFGDLPGLYCAVLEQIFASRDSRHPDEHEDPAAVIDYVWDALLQTAELESGVIDLFNQLLSSGRVPDLMNRSYERLERAFEIISKERPLRVEPKMAAEVYWAAALGMATLVAAAQHGVPYPTGAAKVLRTAVLEGVFGPEEA